MPSKRVEKQIDKILNELNLTWYTYIYDFNAKEIKPYNVFTHVAYLRKILELYLESTSWEDFKKEVDRWTQYYFWSKCEYELILSSWPNKEEEIKIDIYDQLKLNWDKFINYIYLQLNLIEISSTIK